MLTYPPVTKENAEAESLAQSPAMQMSGLVWYPRYLFQEFLEYISVWIFVPIQINKNPFLLLSNYESSLQSSCSCFISCLWVTSNVICLHFSSDIHSVNITSRISDYKAITSN